MYVVYAYIFQSLPGLTGRNIFAKLLRGKGKNTSMYLCNLAFLFSLVVKRIVHHKHTYIYIDYIYDTPGKHYNYLLISLWHLDNTTPCHLKIIGHI